MAVSYRFQDPEDTIELSESYQRSFSMSFIEACWRNKPHFQLEVIWDILYAVHRRPRKTVISS